MSQVEDKDNDRGQSWHWRRKDLKLGIPVEERIFPTRAAGLVAVPAARIRIEESCTRSCSCAKTSVSRTHRPFWRTHKPFTKRAPFSRSELSSSSCGSHYRELGLLFAPIVEGYERYGCRAKCPQSCSAWLCAGRPCSGHTSTCTSSAAS
jgi:hypothetical protein